ncbi:protein RETARDED ROOT GROWTH-LIKE-like isoform X3 [Zingiber officinale]|uniref:protein RETARDED ROOT GROWTH-LIKE-like isoform X3 n=1 Tax=Zingiber officinale TaxID=94328 RepID=UPI001C4B0AAB|nr:protein RETARDED ROOT GROWTH-LIKE-like isoform X3 [Zingiber officinale]
MKGGLDHIMLKSLSVDGIHTIASVLGQSIALDYFIRQLPCLGSVDVMVELFSNINQEMEKTGHFRLKNKMLLQLVGKANSILEAVILKLKLFDRPEIAWKNANYAQIWEYLRDDFELTNRFGSLHFKLEFVERNIAFFRNILQNRKMHFLDSLIVTLLVVEIFMSIYLNVI